MKSSWIALIVVAAVSIGLCLSATALIRSTVEDMDARRLGVL